MTRNAPAASRIRISFTPLAHGVHGLPVVRFLPALYLVELMTCFAPGRKRKSAKVIKGVAPKLEGLGIGHAAIIQNFVFVWQVASGSNGTTNRLSARFFRFLRRPQAERSLMFSASSGVSSMASRTLATRCLLIGRAPSTSHGNAWQPSPDQLCRFSRYSAGSGQARRRHCELGHADDSDATPWANVGGQGPGPPAVGLYESGGLATQTRCGAKGDAHARCLPPPARGFRSALPRPPAGGSAAARYCVAAALAPKKIATPFLVSAVIAVTVKRVLGASTVAMPLKLVVTPSEQLSAICALKALLLLIAVSLPVKLQPVGELPEMPPSLVTVQVVVRALPPATVSQVLAAAAGPAAVASASLWSDAKAALLTPVRDMRLGLLVSVPVPVPRADWPSVFVGASV